MFLLPTPPITPNKFGAGGLTNVLAPPTPRTPDLAPTSSRLLSDAELVRYLPARTEGRGDLYVHQELLARSSLLSQPRVRLAWAILLARHPLLAARVQAKSYSKTSFLHATPSSIDLALARADQQLTYLPESYGEGEAELVDAFLHGPRTLNTDISAVLVVRSTPPPPGAIGETRERAYELMLCCAPYVSTPTGVHALMGELHALLRTRDLTSLLVHEIANPIPFPPALDDTPLTPLQLAVGHLLYAHDRSGPGGQVFWHSPPLPSQIPPCYEPLECVFSEEDTERLHSLCSQHETQFVHVLVFLAAQAFAPQARERQTPTLIELPRPYAPPTPAALPSPTPSENTSSTCSEEMSNPVIVSQFGGVQPEGTWDRARRLTKREQKENLSVRRLAKFKAASRAEAEECIRRARIEDEENPGLGLVGFSMTQRPAPVPESEIGAETEVIAESGAEAESPFELETRSNGTPTKASIESERERRRTLLGIQNLGVLDGLYAPDIEGLVDGLQVRRMATGRRRSGVLLYYFEFGGRATLSVSADEGYDLSRWWDELIRLIEEFFALE